MLAPEERERLLLARDRSIAALLSCYEEFAVPRPGIGDPDPKALEDPDARKRLTDLLEWRVRATRRELLDLAAELSRRYGRAAVGEALDLPVVAIDGILEELADAQADDLRSAERLNYLLRRLIGDLGQDAA